LTFKIGDRAVGKYGPGRVVDVVVVGVGEGETILVHHDTWHPDCHSGAGKCTDGRGWWYSESELALESPAPTTDNPIFYYRAGEDLGESAWEKLCVAVGEVDWNTAKEMFKDWETEYKGSGNPIPSAWRSAKSVIKGALLHSVPVKREDDSVRGKTAVEKDIKAKKEAMKDHVTPGYVFARMVGRAKDYAEQNGLNWKATFQSVINNAE
jgi:hypothetical protein